MPSAGEIIFSKRKIIHKCDKYVEDDSVALLAFFIIESDNTSKNVILILHPENPPPTTTWATILTYAFYFSYRKG